VVLFAFDFNYCCPCFVSQGLCSTRFCYQKFLPQVRGCVLFWPLVAYLTLDGQETGQRECRETCSKGPQA